MKHRILALLLCLASLLLCACEVPKNEDMSGESSSFCESSTQSNTDNSDSAESEDESTDESEDEVSQSEEELDEAAITAFLGSAELLPDEDKLLVTEELIRFVCTSKGRGVIEKITASIKDCSYYRELWHDLTGDTLHVLRERMVGVTSIDLGTTESGLISLGFGGDFSFCDDYVIGPTYFERGKGLDGIMDSEIVEMMKAFDVMTLNNEFCFSDRGTRNNNKSYTFRAPTDRTFIYHDMGVDVLGLANNHVYDFGEVAFLDTLDTVDAAGLQRIGAGRDVDEARRPLYYIINGRKIAYISGSRAEKVYHTPIATQNSSGVFGIYDDAMMCETIKEAKAVADVVILFVHWGAENETYIEDIIQKQGRRYIDSGADVIIGAHAHNLQGVEFYKGKLIAYNIGNYLFNAKNRDTVLMSVEIDSDGTITNKMLPLKQKNCYLSTLSEKEQQRVRDHITSISVNGYVASDNVVREFISVDF